MIYMGRYDSPLGPITLAGEDGALTGLWFDGQKYFGAGLPAGTPEGEPPVFRQVRAWLDRYFRGEDPGPAPPLAPAGTAFQRAVWEVLREIPYGRTATYGQVAQAAGRRLGRNTSPRAAGSVVGRNPISLLIPCHRVVGAGGSLTGYAGGLERKEALLKLEGAANVKKKFDNSGKCNTLKVVRRGDQKVQEHGSV